MDFAFSEEQEMLRSQARTFLSDRFSEERIAELATSDEGWDPASWSAIAELGWLGLSAPESSGGSGMTFLDETVLFEELGRSLYPGPFFSSIALSLPAIEGHEGFVGELVSGASSFTLAWAEAGSSALLEDAANADVQTKADKSGDTWSLSGEKVLVPDLGTATHVVVSARADDGLGLWVVGKDDAEVEVFSTMDATRRYGTLKLAGATGTLVVAPGETEPIFEKIRLRALAALALEAVGIAQKALEIAQVQAKERTQFDKPIGSYQAVSHQVADSYMGTELARSVAYWAAWCVAESDVQAQVAAADAKARAGENAVLVCEKTIQVLGGIGFTWEHVAHRLYKRAQWIDSFEGFGARQRMRVADRILG
jgi:alkylation response protein AidB-like acyl-CoA dehydrogenase